MFFDDGTYGRPHLRRPLVHHHTRCARPDAAISAIIMSGFSYLHAPGGPHVLDSTLGVTITFHTVDVALAGLPSISRIAGDARATSRVLNLTHERAHEWSDEALLSIVERNYSLIEGDRDFLIVIRAALNTGTDPSAPSVSATTAPGSTCP